MKEKVLTSSSKFQIGGQEGHRSQEHLFSLKSVIALKEQIGEGVLFQLYDISKFFDNESLRDVMDTLHDINVDHKVYRAWYMMSKNTRIAVKTGNGMTAEADVGEVIGQGTVGGALASQVNIDRGVERYFCGSRDEENYGTVRLQPIIFQDDIARLAGDVRSAQAGNHKLSYVMKEKQLKVHSDKTGFIAIGKKKFQERIAQEVTESPIMFGEITTKSKVMDKYLGDMIHKDGLSASVQATIEESLGRITAATHEMKTVLDDFRLQAIGGMMGAWDLWNLAVVPSLMNNCSTWIGMSSKLVEKLEAVQESFVRLMMEVPTSTPKVALRAETGLLSMKHRIWYEKINFVQVLRNLKEGLAKEIYEQQLVQGWPGLAKEVKEICNEVDIPDANQVVISRKCLKLAFRNHDSKEIREKMLSYKKLDKIKNDDPTEAKDYMRKKSLADCRIIFRVRTEMIDIKDNMRGKYKGKNINCETCDMKVAESQGHVMVCSGYQELRIGRDMEQDGDLAAYFRDVLLEREKIKLKTIV